MKEKAKILIIDAKLILEIAAILLIVALANIFSEYVNEYISRYVILSLISVRFFTLNFNEINVEEHVLEDLKEKNNILFFSRSPLKDAYFSEKIKRRLFILATLGLMFCSFWQFWSLPVLPLEVQIKFKEAELISAKESLAEQRKIHKRGITK